MNVIYLMKRYMVSLRTNNRVHLPLSILRDNFIFIATVTMMFQARRNKPHSCAAIMDKAVEHVSDVLYAVIFDYDILRDLNIIENTLKELS